MLPSDIYITPTARSWGEVVSMQCLGEQSCMMSAQHDAGLVGQELYGHDLNFQVVTV